VHLSVILQVLNSYRNGGALCRAGSVRCAALWKQAARSIDLLDGGVEFYLMRLLI